MSSKLSTKLLKAYQIHQKNPLSCFIGFDGFTDEIFEVVDQRIDLNHFIPFKKIKKLAARIDEASDRSCNFELVLKQKKIGGNGPILALALAQGGHRIELAAMIGEKEVEPLFIPLVKKVAATHLLGPSGHSEALEFQDGKIIFGRHSPLLNLSADQVVKKIGPNSFKKSLNKCALFVAVNWTMLPMMNDLWAYIAEKIVPDLSMKQRALYVDLADPAKRSLSDLKTALVLLQKLQKRFQVFLGLNYSEADQVAKVLKIKNHGNYLKLATDLQKKLKLEEVILHQAREAVAANSKESFKISTFYTAKPLLNTGAGDNFNAGYCNAILFGFSLKEKLLLAAATAGFYIRKGRSPSMEELAFFLRSWNK